ncbi:MAG: hypothetical protein B1H03_01705 [Planctomycetales bacterium 4484_113]|nr:MAG: hypothetical protein B1H03_01705 [Planctomycetales bacterium 4484_113]
MNIVFASKNPHKFAEVKAVLSAAAQVEQLLALSSLANVPEVEEDGATFSANAEKKAEAYSRWLAEHGHPEYWALAEDAGLEVAALDGFPGVLSSRLASTDGERMTIVLEKLRAVAPADAEVVSEVQSGKEPDWSAVEASHSRLARFVSAMALATGGRVMARSLGTVCGFVAGEPRGKGGFGYDPIFYYPPYRCTFGECSPEQKRAVSHRSRALAAMLTEIDDLMKR